MKYFTILIMLLISAVAEAQDISIDTKHNYCSHDSDCAEIKTTCNQCAPADGLVNSAWVKHYSELYAQTCKNEIAAVTKHGLACSYAVPAQEKKCLQSQCQYIPSH